MLYSFLKTFSFIVVVSFFINGCDSGCIEADDYGNLAISHQTKVYPINQKVITRTNTSSVPITTANMALLTQSFMLQPGTTNQQAQSNMWTNFLYDSRSSGSNIPLIVYQNYPVNINISGTILLNGSQDIVTIPFTFDKLQMNGKDTYFLPMVNSNMSLVANTNLQIVVMPTTLASTTTVPTPTSSNPNATTSVTVENTTPVLDGIFLQNGLGVFAAISPDPNNLAPYSDQSAWGCQNGTGGTNTVKSTTGNPPMNAGGGTFGGMAIAALSNPLTAFLSPIYAAKAALLITTCASSGSGADGITSSPINIDESQCDPSILTGECAGFAYDSDKNATLAATNFSTSGYLFSEGESVFTKYLFFSVSDTLRNFSLVASGMSAAGSSSLANFRGIGYTGQTMRGSYNFGDIPVYSGKSNFRIYNPWVWNADFAICTHNNAINGWATNTNSDDTNFQNAKMASNGALSHWFFENGECSDIDDKYHISLVNQKYGGNVYYNIAQTNIWWGGLNTDRITSCSSCDNNTFNGGMTNGTYLNKTLGTCDNLSCMFNIAGREKSITPKFCRAKDFKAYYPLQYIAFNNMVSDGTHINANAGAKPTPSDNAGTNCGEGNYKYEDVRQYATCNYSLTVNGQNSTYYDQTVNKWTVLGGPFKKDDTVSVDVSGGYSQVMGFGGNRRYIQNTTLGTMYLSAVALALANCPLAPFSPLCIEGTGTQLGLVAYTGTGFTALANSSTCCVPDDSIYSPNSTTDGFLTNNKFPYRDLGTKNCRATTMFAVKQVPFVSCLSGYQNGCSNKRNPSTDATDSQNGCGGKATYTDSNNRSETVSVGSCNKIINGVSMPQKYSNFANKVINSLVNSPNQFVVAENVWTNHCGICLKANLTTKPNTVYPIASSSDIINDNTLQTATDCLSNSNYQWVQSYVDSSTSNLITYLPAINSVASFCADDHMNAKTINGLTSLTSLMHSNQYSGSTIYGEVGSFIDGVPAKTSASMVYQIPENMDGASISFGVAGHGSDITKMYNLADKTANNVSSKDKSGNTVNTDLFFDVLLQSGLPAQNGKYLFFYIQPFTVDNNGNYTQTLDATKDPNVLFANLTHDQIYKKGTVGSPPLLIDFYNVALSSGDVVVNGGISGAGQFIPPISGLLWSVILDIPPSTLFPSDTTGGKDRDGFEISYKKSVKGDPGVLSDFTNVSSWNNGNYTVNIKAQLPVSNVSELGNTIITSVINFVKSLFFGPIITGKCQSVLTNSTPPVKSQIYNTTSASSEPYTPQYCSTSGTMQTKEVIPTLLSSAVNNNANATFYQCSQTSTAAYTCQLYYTAGSTPVNTNSVGVPMILNRYGNCNTGASNSNSQICTVYNFNQNNTDLNGCLRSDYSDKLCWTTSSQKVTIPYPYGYIVNNDMVPGNIMPICNTNKPYKTYVNCSMNGAQQKCDINRDCFPDHNATYTSLQIEVPLFISQGNDLGLNSSYDDSIKSISGCANQPIDTVKSSYCIPDPKDPGYLKCDLTSSGLATCATCNRPDILGVPLSSYSVSSVGHSCASNTNSYFYCDNAAYNACLANAQGKSSSASDIVFPRSGNNISTDNITICNISSINPNLNTRISTSVMSSPLPMSLCNINRTCHYNSYTPPSTPSSSISSSSLTTDSAGAVTEICEQTYNWQAGLIYQLLTLFTTSSSIIVVFYVAIILYITLRGLAIFLGTQVMTMAELGKQIISIAFVLMFCSPTSWNNYQHFILEFYVRFTQGLNTMIAGIVMPNDTNNGTNLFGPVDAVLNATFLNQTFWIKLSAVIFSSWYGWIIFLCILLSLVLYILTSFQGVAMYLSTVIMSSILFCVGPIFIILLLFEETKQYFETWKSQIIGMIVSQAYLFAIIAIFSSLYLGVVDGILYFKVCFKALFSLPVINVTLLGWWKIASNALPEAILYQIGNSNALLTAYDNNVPNIAKTILLFLIMALYSKTISEHLVGNKAGTEAAAPVTAALDQVKGATTNLVQSAVMAPVKGAESIANKATGGLYGSISGGGISGNLKGITPTTGRTSKAIFSKIFGGGKKDDK